MKQCSPAGNSARTKGAGDPGSVRALSRKLAAEFLGTLWLVLSGCGSPVLAAEFPEAAALAVLDGPIAGTVVAGLVHARLWAEDSSTDREAAVREAALSPGEALAPATAREPR